MSQLPELALEPWEPTKDTLHLWTQIVGKVRLAATPPQNHWWNVTLYVDTRGLTTRRLRSDDCDFDLSFDFVAHELVVRTSRGEVNSFPLADGLSVAAFHERFFALLAGLGIEVETKAEPFGIPVTTPFAEDAEHASYDRDAVERFWQALRWIDWTLQEFAGWFCGKTSPVHLFWHGLDLAVTRFSGRPAPAMPKADAVTREAYTHESSASVSGPATGRSARPPSTRIRRLSPQVSPKSRSVPRRRAGSDPSARAISRSSPTTRFGTRPIPAKPCSTSSRALTKRVQQSPAGMKKACARAGARRPSSGRPERRRKHEDPG